MTSTRDARRCHCRAKRAGTLLLLLAGFFASVLALASEQRDFPGKPVDVDHPPGRLVDVRGYPTHLFCRGQGTPTVVLEAGLGGSSLEWLPVQAYLSRHTRVCSYDRPGYGWSAPVHSPRNALTIAAELRDLLSTSGERGPYVLVGHSLGGHIVRVFAGRYPALMAGMVLVDASHEDMFRNLRTRPFTMVVSTRPASAVRSVLPGSLPTRFRETALQFAERTPTRVAIKSETYYFIRSGEEARLSQPPANMPVTVISRGVLQAGRNPAEAHMAQDWDDLQRDLHQRMGTSGQVTATRSGHYPHLDEPELVSHAILGVVRSDQGQPLVSR